MDDHRLTRIEDKIDGIVDRLGSIDVTLAKQHVSLTEHMARTVLLEQAIIPVKKKFYMVEGALKLLTGSALAVGAIYTIIKIIEIASS